MDDSSAANPAPIRTGRNRDRDNLPGRVSSHGDWRTFILYVATFAGIVIALNVWVAHSKLPDYGTWTGSRPFEKKLELLEKFASKGPVDILLLSSSIGDHGISSDTLSEQMTAFRGRPVRVFNLATGGAGLPFYPIAYRLARSIVVPREIVIVLPPDPANDALDADMSRPENVLRHAPIGAVIDSPWKLAIALRFWRIPIIRNASALRDYALYGKYENRVKTNMDIYAFSEAGDTVNYSVVRRDADIQRFQAARVKIVGTLWKHEKYEPDPLRRLSLYVSDKQIAFARELQDLAKSDGAGIRLLAEDAASLLGVDDEGYRAGRRSFYEHLAESTGLPVVNFADRYRVRRYEIGDLQHLNRVGARRFTLAAAAALSGRPVNDDRPAPPFPDSAQIAPNDSSFGMWTAVLASDASKGGQTLEIKVVQTWETPVMSLDEPIEVILRSPENKDVILPTIVTGPGVGLCDVSSLPQIGRAHV